MKQSDLRVHVGWDAAGLDFVIEVNDEALPSDRASLARHAKRYSDEGAFVGDRGTRYGLEFNARGTDPCATLPANDRVLYGTCSHMIVESSDDKLVLFRRAVAQRDDKDAPVAFEAGAWSATIEEQPSPKDVPVGHGVLTGAGKSLLFNAARRGLGEELLDTRDVDQVRTETAEMLMLSVYFEPSPWFVDMLFYVRLSLPADRAHVDLMRVSDAVRREAMATYRANAGATTDDGAEIARPIKVGRNEKCPCGSGKKWKKCCGAAERMQ